LRSPRAPAVARRGTGGGCEPGRSLRRRAWS
jgi:hypothetical protein